MKEGEIRLSVKEYKLELEVVREMFFNEEDLYGIYSCKPVHYNKEIINKWGNLSIKGTTRRLAVGDTYEIKFEGKYDDAYGGHFIIQEVAAEKLNSVEDQDKFLKAVLADNHFKSLKDAYPNVKLVDLILEDKVDVSKTKGIKKKTLAKIKDTVEKNAGVSVLIAKLQGLNLSTGRIEKIMQHFGSSDLATKAIENNIYSLCDISTFGFLTVDKSALERGDNPTNEKRIKACIDYLLKKDNQNGHTFSIKEEILENATELLEIDYDLVGNVIDIISNNKQYYVDDERIAFSSARNKEKNIFKELKRIRDSYISPDVTNIEDRLIDAEIQQGFKFTDEQRKTIIESAKHGVSVINGKGGTGKTQIVKSLIDSLGYPKYMTAALSGKASSVLIQRGIKSSTIHRMLGKSENGGFLYGEDKKLPYDIVVIDEVSMINIDLFLSVVKAIKDGGKLLIVGDSGQLPAIGIGDILRDLLQTNEFPKFELTKVHRQAAKSGILQLANEIREGNQIMPYDSNGKETYGELQDQTVISYSDRNSIPYNVLEIARVYKSRIKTPQDLLDFQVIVSNRERGELSVRKMNVEMQKIFNSNDKPSLSRNGYDFKSGDKVIAQGNSYGQYAFNDEFEYYDFLDGDEEESIREVDIFNGTMGYVQDVSIKHKVVFIQFEGIDGLVVFHQNDLDKIDLAYCITVHKSQGSSVNHLVFALDFSSYTLLSRQLVYTALTRCSLRGVALVESKALHKAIETNASSRRTFLQEIIRGDNL